MFGWTKKIRDEFEAVPETVAEQVTDSVTTANVANLGSTPAVSLDQALLAQSQAHAVLFANMVSEQQRLVNAGQAAAMKSAAEIFGIASSDESQD